MKKALCIISGGMDSAFCSYVAKKIDNYEIIALHFNYGQRTETRELKAFNDICDDLKVYKRVVLDIQFIKKIGASSLVDESMEILASGKIGDIPNTYVPFRNGIFISIAAALAEKEGAEALYLGVMEEDSSGYPDCTEEFIKKMKLAINEGTKKETNLDIKTPLIHLKKEDIVKEAQNLQVPLKLTWSCYKNEDKACGVCDSCKLRLKGFKKANIKDEIPYM